MEHDSFRFGWWILFLPVITLISGCAGVTYTPIPYKSISAVQLGNNSWTDVDPGKANDANHLADAEVDGIRYFDTSLYVLVYADGKGGASWQILELPDQSKPMAVKPHNFMAQLDSTLQFNNGMLFATKESIDNTAIPKAVIDTVAKVLPSLLGAAALLAQRNGGASANPRHTDYTIPAIALYKINVEGDKIELDGGPVDTPMRVRLNSSLIVKP